MNKTQVNQIKLIGLSLKKKTMNENGQSSIDCENLWHEFEKAKHIDIIPNKSGDEIYGVYYQYEGDSSKPFSYFIGCRVSDNAVVPAGLDALIIPQGIYEKVIAKGKMPECLINAWKEIWKSSINRSYQIDFEVYDKRSKDWSNGEVDIYISLK